MAKLRAVFRGTLTFRPFVLATSGLALVILALAVQTYASYTLWVERDRRANWNTSLAVDFRREGSWQTDFRPIVSRDHTVQFTLRAPLEGDLAGYNGKQEELPAAVRQRSLAGKEFALSWQVLRQKDVVARGKVRSSDLTAWAMKDQARYQYFFHSMMLKAGQKYTFTAQVEQANPAVNELSPVLQVGTHSALKGRLLACNWRLWHTLLFCGVGVVLLLVAYARYVYNRRLASGLRA